MAQEIKYIKIISYNNFPYGGASANYVRNLAFALQNKDVDVLLPTGNIYGHYIDNHICKVNKIKTTTYRHLGFSKHSKNYFGKIFDYIYGALHLYFYILEKKMKKEVNLIIKYDVSFNNDLLLLLFAKFLNIKLIYVIVEFYKKPSRSLMSLSFYKWLDFYFGITLLPKYADGIIVLTTFLENFILKKFDYKKPILIQPNLVDSSFFDNSKIIASYKDGFKTIGYCGVLNPKDGIYDLLNSFQMLLEKHPKTHLLIIGDITNGSSIIPELKKYTSKLKIIKNVTFTGLVSTEKVPALLNACDILALPRKSGIFAEAGFPTKLGEYFACKKPVVVSKVGDIPKYFTNYKEVVLVEPDNPLSLFSGFNYLLLNEKQASIIGANGYHWMKNNLDYPVVSKRLLDFIDNVYFRR